MADKTIVEATRVAAGDDRARYDGASMALHWATALLVVTLYGLAQTWDFFPRGSPGRHAMQALHVGLGLLLTAVLAARILWRLGPGRKLHPASAGFVELAAKVAHYGLYALLGAEAVLGWCFRWSQKELLGVPGLFAIPSPYAFTEGQRHWLGFLHEQTANVIIAVACLHAAAALYHHFALRDDVLSRMLPGREARTAKPG